MQEMQVQSLGQEDPLQKEMATHFSIQIPWTEEPGKLQFMELQKSWTWLSDEQHQRDLELLYLLHSRM